MVSGVQGNSLQKQDLLLKPCVTHYEIAILSSGLAPGVLNLVADGLAGWVKVDTRNDHSVSHCRVADLEAVGFAQPELDIKGILPKANEMMSDQK